MGQVCLTAVMTLFAGIPQSYCLCPDGRLSLFCPGWTGRSSACRCANPSAASVPPCACCADQPQKHSCCTGPNVRQMKEPSSRLQSVGCRQLRAVTLDRAPSAEKITWELSQVLDSALPVLAVLTSSVPLPTSPGLSWQIHLPAPPLDLVTTYRHFVI